MTNLPPPPGQLPGDQPPGAIPGSLPGSLPPPPGQAPGSAPGSMAGSMPPPPDYSAMLIPSSAPPPPAQAPPPATPGVYLCAYCRIQSDGSAQSCPHCGAPVDIRTRVTDSGWEEQPAIKDMAKIQFGRSSCQIEGKFVPVADMGLAEGDWVYFSHHVLLWANPSVVMGTMPMKGAWNRVFAGMPLVMMQAQGPGHIAFSHDHPGETVAIPLQHGQSMEVTEHRFLVATGSVTYNFHQSGIWYTTGSGDDTETHYPLGMYMDTFVAQDGPGLLLLHAPGNVFIRDLQPGQNILIQPSALLYKDPSVGMHLHFEYPAGSYGFAGFVGRAYQAKTTWLRLRGPGRVAVQSVFERPEAAYQVTGSSGASVYTWT